jgi:uracil-DNA glycosylase
MDNINIKEKKDYFIPLLEKSGWDSIKELVQSPMFDDILIKLINEVNQGRRFTPIYKDIFNAFLECPYQDTKVVIIGQDPYPQLGVADGIAFSCSKTGKAEKSLQYILKQTVGNFTDTGRVIYTPEECDLRRWANQGVLLLNTALTTQVSKIGSHYTIWSSFMNKVFQELNEHGDLIIALLGKKAEAYEIALSNNTIFKVTHPASAAYRGGEWDCNDLFNKINQELKLKGKPLINW